MPLDSHTNDLEIEKAEALVELRLHLQGIMERRWPPWKARIRQREVQTTVNAYVDRIVMSRLGGVLLSPILREEFDPKEFVDEVLEEAKTFAESPDVDRLAGTHREIIVASVRAIYLRELSSRIPVSIEDLTRSGDAANQAARESSEVEAEGHSRPTERTSSDKADVDQMPTGERVTKDVVLPSLPREALKRIENAEREAKARYDEDKIPYFPLHPEFSFLEESIFRSIQRILEYLQILAQELLDAHLKEYLEYSPAELFNYQGLLGMLAPSVGTVLDQLWTGYGYTLQLEPTSRRARLDIAIATGTIADKPELEPLRYPPKEQWADFLSRMREPDSEMSRLNAQYEAAMFSVLQNRIKYYQQEAISRNPDLREKLKKISDIQDAPGVSHESAAARENGASEDVTAADVCPGRIAAESITDTGPPVETVTIEEKLVWADIGIRFLSTELIEIVTRGERQIRNYAEMNCEDRRSKKPNLAWQTLAELARQGGVLDGRVTLGRDRSRVHKRIQETRRLLQNKFPISEDPIPFDDLTGYRTRFRISWSLSADA